MIHVVETVPERAAQEGEVCRSGRPEVSGHERRGQRRREVAQLQGHRAGRIQGRNEKISKCLMSEGKDYVIPRPAERARFTQTFTRYSSNKSE